MPAAIMGGSSLLGGMLGKGGAQQSANDAASAQQKLASDELKQLEGYDQQQNQQERSAISGLLAGGNPFFSAMRGMKPQFLAPGKDEAVFSSSPAPGTFNAGAPQAQLVNPFTAPPPPAHPMAPAPPPPAAGRGLPGKPPMALPGQIRNPFLGRTGLM